MIEKLPDASDFLWPSEYHRGDDPGGPLAGTRSLTLNLRNPICPVAPFESRPERSGSYTDGILPVEYPLLGDYELLAVVGRGGMGIVYKARHRTLNRIVALKVTDAGHLGSSEAAQRFRSEAAAIARLDHPNIVPIYETGEAFGQQFYAMAFVEGTNLAHEVAISPLQPRRAAGLIRAVAAAIAYAHGRGVVHRDLKPDNILLDAADRPRITDFGIAKCSDTDSRLTQAGMVIGTPSYMSPEQAQGHSDRVGPPSDVYALGATLYCLLTGRPPFQAATALDTLKQVVERDPVSPRRLNPAVDRDLETICLKCLEKSPERRYASATALAEDLQRFLEHRSILARPASPVGKATRWCWRNPSIAGSLAGVIAMFLTAFALVSWSYWREAEQRAAADDARDDARRHERAERWERYRANMTAVSSAFQSQNGSMARRAIDAAPTAHRGWEWHHFRHQLDQSQQVLASSGDGVAGVRFAGNNRLVTEDSAMHVWDLPTGRLIRTLDDLNAVGRTWNLDPKGRWLAYTNRANSITLWDIDADRRHSTLPGGAVPFSNLAFADDSRTLVACTHHAQAAIWDTATGNRLRSWSFPDRQEGTLGCEIGGRSLMVNRFKDGTVNVWNLQTGHKQYALTALNTHAISTEFNPQRNRVVTSEGYPSNVMRLWDAETGKQLALLRGHTNLAHLVRFSPDGGRLASCSFDQTVRLWDGRTGAPVATLRGHSGRVLAAAFSPDSKRLVSASQDHTLRLWDATNGESIAVLRGHAGEVVSVDYSPDGARIASSSTDGTTRVWDAHLAERNGVLRGHSTFVYGVAFHPDGERLASASWDGTVRLWNATSGRETAVIRYPTKTIINSVAIDPSGELLATLGRDNAVRLWDVGTGKPLHQWSMPTDHWQDSRLTFSPNGNLLAAGSIDGSVHILDVRGRGTWAVLPGHRGNVHDVAFSPDGRLLASADAGPDRSIRIWDVAKKELVQVLQGHTDEVIALAFSPDGKLLACGSTEGEVRLWNTSTWQQVGVLKHGTTVYSVAFTPDGTRVFTGCADNSIRIWDVPTRQEVAELRGHGSYVKALAFSPDGTRLASASGDFTVRVWDTLSARERGRDEKRAGER